MQERKLEIKLNGKTLTSPTVMAAGGTKKIIDIGDDQVIAVMWANSSLLDRFTDAEVKLSNKIRQLGLHSLPYEKTTAEINGTPNVPVLIMPSFESMARNGKQIRDSKNRDSSCGESTIFGNMQNLKSIEHWRKVFSHIKNEMVIYLINNLMFGSDSFNLSIEDTERTAEAKARQSSTLFSDLEQEIHLFFFDFNDTDHFYKEDVYYEFIDKSSLVLDYEISGEANYLFDKIINILFCCVSEAEYKAIMQEDFFVTLDRLEDASREARLELKCEVVLNVLTEVKAHLEKLSSSDKVEKWKKWKHEEQKKKIRIEKFWASVRKSVKEAEDAENKNNDTANYQSTSCLMM